MRILAFAFALPLLFVAALLLPAAARRLVITNSTTVRQRGWMMAVTPSKIVRVKARLLCMAALSIAALMVSANTYALTDLFASTTEGTIYRIDAFGNFTVFASGLLGAHEIEFDNDGNLFVAQTSGDQITRVTPTGITSTFFQFPGNDNPEGLAFSDDGTLFVSGTNRSLTAISLSGVGSVFAQVGRQESLSVTIDASGNFFVTDLASQNGGEIWKVTPSGVSTVLAAGLGGFPFGITVGPDGFLYVSMNAALDQILRMDPVTGVHGVFATENTTTWNPQALVFDDHGRLFVGTQGGISIIDGDGNISDFVTGLGIGEVRGLAFAPPVAIPEAVGGDFQECSEEDGAQVTFVMSVLGDFVPETIEWFLDGGDEPFASGEMPTAFIGLGEHIVEIEVTTTESDVLTGATLIEVGDTTLPEITILLAGPNGRPATSQTRNVTVHFDALDICDPTPVTMATGGTQMFDGETIRIQPKKGSITVPGDTFMVTVTATDGSDNTAVEEVVLPLAP